MLYVGDSWVCCSLKYGSSVVWAYGVDLCSSGWAFGVDLISWFGVDLVSLGWASYIDVHLAFLVELDLSRSGVAPNPFG